jgi:hypothetical protein
MAPSPEAVKEAARSKDLILKSRKAPEWISICGAPGESMTKALAVAVVGLAKSFGIEFKPGPQGDPVRTDRAAPRS